MPSRATKGLHHVSRRLSLPGQELPLTVQFTPPKLTSGSLYRHLLHKCMSERKSEWTKQSANTLVAMEMKSTRLTGTNQVGGLGKHWAPWLHYLPHIHKNSHGKQYSLHCTGEETGWERGPKPPAHKFGPHLCHSCPLSRSSLSPPRRKINLWNPNKRMHLLGECRSRQRRGEVFRNSFLQWQLTGPAPQRSRAPANQQEHPGQPSGSPHLGYCCRN